MLHSRTRRPTWWMAAIQIVLLLAMLVTPASAATSPTPLNGTQLIRLLQDYGVVRGDEQGNLNLDQPIRRSEMITIMVRALGKDADASLYSSLNTFPDAKNHWASGYITIAAMNRLIKGDENGMVRPNDYITYGEAFTMILRLVGKEPTVGEWPTNVFLEALDQKIVPEGITITDLKSRAIRGLVFGSLGKAITTLTTPEGTTYLAKYLDTAPPTINVNPVAETLDAIATVSGTAKDATAVSINGQSASLSGGAFTGQVNLEYGTNTVTVQAEDIAGNKATGTITVTRLAQAERIVVEGPATVQVGQTATITATAYDKANKPLPANQMKVAVEGTAGQYTAANGQFKAGATPGNVTLTFAVGALKQTLPVSVVGLAPGASRLQFDPTSGMSFMLGALNTVKVQVLDASGNVLTADNGRAVSLLANGLSNVSILPLMAKTVNGVATFTVSSPVAGTAVLSANSEGLTFINQQVTFNTPVHVVLTTTGTSLNPGNTAVIRATLVDQNNTPTANNTLSEMRIALTRGGVVDGNLSMGELVIPAGAVSSQGYDITYTAGYTQGTVVLGGTITKGPSYTVIGVSISQIPIIYGGGVSTPGGGTGNAGPASRLEIIGVSDPQNTGEVNLILRVTDYQGNTVTTGNYAFQVTATTTNGDALGVTDRNVLNVGLGGNAGPRPISGVDTGVTIGGLAKLTLKYTRSGVVTLTPVTSVAVTAGKDDTGATREGTSTSGFSITPATVSFSKGAPTAVKLTASSTYGATYSGAATDAPTSLNGTVTLTATLTDDTGAMVPNGDRRVTLWKIIEGVPTQIGTRGTSSGTVTFTVQGAADTADETYYATAENIAAPNPQPALTVHTRKVALTTTPSIVLMRGATDSGPGEMGKVSLSDAYLQLLVEPTTTANSWGVVRVHRNGGLFYTSPVMRLDGGLLVVNVPKAGISTGDTFRVSFHNGYAETAQSAQTAAVTVISLASNTTISSAYFDADPVAPKLYLSVNTYLSSATLDATKLVLTAPDSAVAPVMAGAPTINGSSFVIDLTGQNAVLAALQPDSTTRSFAGDVLLTAKEGWFTASGGAVGQKVTTAISVKPFATITRALLDTVNSRLILDTVGTTGGYWNGAKISIGAVTLNGSPTQDNVIPGRWSYSLTETQRTQLAQTKANLVADFGWYYVSYSATHKAAKVTVPVSAAATLRGATYSSSTGVLTIAGSGFTTVKRDTNDPAVITGFDYTKITVTNEAPGGTPATLALDAQTQVSVVNDSLLTITLKNQNKTAMDGFSGNLVFLTTNTGWLVDTGDRPAAVVTGHQCGVGFSN